MSLVRQLGFGIAMLIERVRLVPIFWRKLTIWDKVAIWVMICGTVVWVSFWVVLALYLLLYPPEPWPYPSVP